MDRSYEANKTGLVFSDFYMIFDEFCKIFDFTEKEKNERKEKGLHGLGPTTMKSTQLKGFSPG
jgi:hypothetical protein